MENKKSDQEYICELCLSDKLRFVFSGEDKLLGIPGIFSIYQCNTCGLYQIYPKLSEDQIKKYYPPEYICYLGAIEDEKNVLKRIDRYLGQEKRCHQVKKHINNKGKILDVGCATGIFLNAMKTKGWECKGIEPDQGAASYAKERFGLDVFNGNLHEAQLKNNSFDVVSLWDVLEHVQDLHLTTEEVFRVLKPGGYVIGTLPNANSINRYIFGDYWLGWEMPRHYRTFNPKTISKFLTSKNFIDVKIFSFTGHHGAFMLSVGFWLRKLNITKWKKVFLERILGSVVFRILTLPLFLTLDLINRSSVMAFVAYKPLSIENNT